MGDQEGDKERLDRELLELLNELRVALPGVQVLFAFLLTVPFSQRFSSITSLQENVYFVGFLCAASSTAFLIAPTAYHRLQWRGGDKEKLLELSNAFAIAGMVFLALAITCVVFVITDIIFGGAPTSIVTAISAAVFALLWFVLPLYRRVKS